MSKDERIVRRLAAIYALRHGHRAVMLVGQRIAEAVNAGRMRDVRCWQRVRAALWERYAAVA